MLLCARFFILKQLVQRIPVNTDVTDARRRWVLAQVLPPRLRYHGDDLFVRVLRGLQGAETETMLDVIRSLLDSIMSEREDLFPRKNNPIEDLFGLTEVNHFTKNKARFGPRPGGKELDIFSSHLCLVDHDE